MPSLRQLKYSKKWQTYYGKPNRICKNCGRQSVAEYTYKELSEDNKKLIRKGLLERVSLEGLSRMLEIPIHQIYSYMDVLYSNIPDDLNFDMSSMDNDYECVCIDTESDEAWSFVGNKANKQWIWAIIHTQSRQVIAVYVGDRSRERWGALYRKIGR